MGFLDSFNNLTNQINKKVNELADNLTNSVSNAVNNNDVSNIPQQDISNSVDGLGSISTTSCNGTPLETPGANMYKYDTDSRKLITNIEDINTHEEYCNKIRKFIDDTGAFIITDLSDDIKSKINYSSIFKIRHTTGNEYYVVPVLNVNNLVELIESIGKNIRTMDNTKIAIVGYCQYCDEISYAAKKYNVELFGSTDVFEVNSAVDLADKGLPYISFNKNSFAYLLASTLNDMYKKKNNSTVCVNDINTDANDTNKSVQSETTQNCGVNISKGVSLHKE